MKLFGYPVNQGDTVYSASMGSGQVEQLSAHGFYVNHSGQHWRYNTEGTRSGCKLSDLSWRPKLCGLQIKDDEKYSAAQSVIADVTLSLRKHYG